MVFVREKDICKYNCKLLFTSWIFTGLEILVLGSLALRLREDKSGQAFAVAPAAESTMENLVILYFQSDSGDEKREAKANCAEVNERMLN